MASIINAATSGGLITTADTSGILQLQTAGTTAVTVDASQRAAFVAGTAALPAITTTGDTNTGIFFPTADTIAFAEGGAEAMRIDSSGNLGLGVTPSAWSGYKALQVNNGAFANSSGTTLVGWNSYYDGTNYRYIVTGQSSQMLISPTGGGGFAWFNAASGTAGNAITFTQAMTLDSSGNLLVGLTTANATLHVQGATTTDGSIKFNNQLNSTGAYNASPQSGSLVALKYNTAGDYAGMGGWSIGKENATDGNFSSYFAMHTRANGGAIAERARIDSSGNLLVGTTSTIGGVTGGSIQVQNNGSSSFIAKQLNATADTLSVWSSTTAGNNIFAQFYTETAITSRGSISYNRAGGLVAYNTTSDYRAKDISGPLTGSGALIDSVPVYMGTMKGATQERPMFIAHEVPAYAHTGEKDAVDADGNPVYQQMDASALIPVMWAEIQSLRKRLADAGL